MNHPVTQFHAMQFHAMQCERKNRDATWTVKVRHATAMARKPGHSLAPSPSQQRYSPTCHPGNSRDGVAIDCCCGFLTLPGSPSRPLTPFIGPPIIDLPTTCPHLVTSTCRATSKNSLPLHLTTVMTWGYCYAPRTFRCVDAATRTLSDTTRTATNS